MVENADSTNASPPSAAPTEAKTSLSKVSERRAQLLVQLDTLSREGLINLIRKQLAVTKEARRQAAEAKKELEEARAERHTDDSQGANHGLVQLQLELSDYKKGHDQLKKKLEQSEAVAKEKDAAIADLSQRLHTWSEQNAELQMENEKLSGKLQCVEKMLEEQDERLKQDGQSLSAALTEADELRKKTDDEAEELRSTVSRQLNELGDLRRELADNREETSRLTSLNELLQRKLDSLRNDFEEYKDRAEFVLKQSSDKKERQAVDGFEIEELNRQLRDKTNELAEQTRGVQSLQHELNTVRERNRDLKAELEDVRVSLGLAQKEAADSRRRLAKEHEERVKSLTAETEFLRKELNTLKEASREERTSQERISAQQFADLNAQLQSLSRQLEEAKLEGSGAAAAVPSKSALTRDPTKKSTAMPINFETETLFSAAAAAGRTSECSDDADLVRSLRDVIGGSSWDETETVHPLGDALEDWPGLPEPELLSQQLEHTRELLSETEETNVKLEEQVKLLKEEIRRSERDRQRSQHLAKNTEYLKNVVLKFLAPEKVNDGRTQLLPVLCTLLGLSPEEKAQVERHLAQPEQAAPAAQSEWPGFLSSIF